MARLTTTAPTASGLGTRSARWALVFVWFTGVLSGFIQGYPDHDLPRVVLAYAVVLAGAVLLTTPGARPLPVWRAALVAAVPVVVAALALPQAHGSGDVWLIDIGGYLVGLLVARGNVVLGWIGLVAVAVEVVAGNVVLSGVDVDAAAILAKPVMAVIVGTVWRIVVAGMVRRERALRSASALAALESAALETATITSRAELDEILALVRPALDRIVDGSPLSDEERRQIVALEAQVRDRLRAPALSIPVIAGSAFAARLRGVEVVLLGDRSTGRNTVGGELGMRLAQLIDGMGAGRVSIRVNPAGRASDVTVVTHEGRDRRRYEFHDAALARIPADDPRVGES